MPTKDDEKVTEGFPRDTNEPVGTDEESGPPVSDFIIVLPE